MALSFTFNSKYKKNIKHKFLNLKKVGLRSQRPYDISFPPLLRRNDLRDPPKWVNDGNVKNIWANKIWRNLNWQGFTRIAKDRGPIKNGFELKK